MKNITYILLIVLLANTGCKGENTSNETLAENTGISTQNNIVVTSVQFERNNMKLGSLSEQDFPDIIEVTGMVNVSPQSKEIISPLYGGFVKKSNLIIGDKVRKGQALITIENPDFIDIQQDYLEIKEQLAYLKAEYDRKKVLFSEEITSKKEFLKAESEYKQKKATLSGLRKKINMLNMNIKNIEKGDFTSQVTLYSSISGSVSNLNVIKGQYISPADEILEITNTDEIILELKAFERDALKIKKGQKIKFKIPEISNKYYNAIVHLVSNTIDEQSRTIIIQAHINDDVSLNIGMFVDAEVNLNNTKAFSVPEATVIENGNERIILKLEKQENDSYYFKPVSVSVGKKHNGFVEILSKNIAKEDRLLISGGYVLVGE